MYKKAALEIADASRTTDVPSPRRSAFVYGSFDGDSKIIVDALYLLTDEELRPGLNQVTRSALRRPWINRLYANGKNRRNVIAIPAILGTVDKVDGFHAVCVEFYINGDHEHAQKCLQASGSELHFVGTTETERSLDDLLRQKVFERVGFARGYFGELNAQMMPCDMEEILRSERLESYLLDHRDGLLHTSPAERSFSEHSLREFAQLHDEYSEIIESMIFLSHSPSRAHRKAIYLEICKASAVFSGEFKRATAIKKKITEVTEPQ